MSDEMKPFEALEQRLNDRKTEYDAMSVPDAAAYQAVQAGIRQAARKRKSRLRWVMSSISAAAIILVFTGCIRVSPAFASFVEQLPGMEGIVSMIRQDKGLMMAIDQSLLQKVGVTDEHDGASLTVEGIITDESRMVIFYTMKGMKDMEKGRYDIDLLDRDEKKLPVAFSYFSPTPASESGIYEDKIDVSFTESLPPQELTVVFKERGKEPNNKWKVTFPVDRSLTKDMKKIIPVNQTMTVDGQRIQVKQAVLYPTRLVLDIEYDRNNTKKIFGIRDLQLVDEQGRAWRTDSSSISGSGSSVFFESMYFSAPKKLTLQGSGLSAVDKDELVISIDPSSGEIQGGPSSLKFLKSTAQGKNLILEFSIADAQNATSGLSFTNIKDSKGNPFDINELGWSPSVFEARVVIKNGAAAKGNLTMEIDSYPDQNRAPFSIEIPVTP
ncbi:MULTISPECIES: DUF4179 domain-containing protein [Paenibacillus]|uniref:Uncharacterized protein DUF4179 n=1 Tax=Paenibacillus pabuli TaxID=1472 RepID=A0A855YI37_9BACL|nr:MULTISPECIES: DUF4179 domain-containing protein [Paenibacillus]PWW45420.1 uncharacterized protein DUF4179 [Paenibacillus pabuli]PXW11757.1 uncharacterized protein DUF4179 [Paenibacillus taichungensis]